MARQHNAPGIPERLRRDIVQHRLHRRCSVAFALLGGVNHHVPNVVFRHVVVVNHHDVSHHPRISVNAERLALRAVNIRLRQTANRVGNESGLLIAQRQGKRVEKVAFINGLECNQHACFLSCICFFGKTTETNKKRMSGALSSHLFGKAGRKFPHVRLLEKRLLCYDEKAEQKGEQL